MIRGSRRASVVLAVGNHDEEVVCCGNAGGASDDVVLLHELVSRERVVVVGRIVVAVVCDEWAAHIHDEAEEVAARMVEEGIYNEAALSSVRLVALDKVVVVFHGAVAGGSTAAAEVIVVWRRGVPLHCCCQGTGWFPIELLPVLLISRSIKLLLYRPSSSSCLSSPLST